MWVNRSGGRGHGIHCSERCVCVWTLIASRGVGMNYRLRGCGCELIALRGVGWN